MSSHDAICVVLYISAASERPYLLEMVRSHSYSICSIEEQIKPCHTAAEDWWDEASPAVRTEDFQCVDACSVQSTHSAFQHSLV